MAAPRRRQPTLNSTRRSYKRASKAHTRARREFVKSANRWDNSTRSAYRASKRAVRKPTRANKAKMGRAQSRSHVSAAVARYDYRQSQRALNMRSRARTRYTNARLRAARSRAAARCNTRVSRVRANYRAKAKR